MERKFLGCSFTAKAPQKRLICLTHYFAGAAPPCAMMCRIFAFTAVRAFFFGVVNDAVRNVTWSLLRTLDLYHKDPSQCFS